MGFFQSLLTRKSADRESVSSSDEVQRDDRLNPEGTSSQQSETHARPTTHKTHSLNSKPQHNASSWETAEYLVKGQPSHNESDLTDWLDQTIAGDQTSPLVQSSVDTGLTIVAGEPDARVDINHQSRRDDQSSEINSLSPVDIGGELTLGLEISPKKHPTTPMYAMPPVAWVQLEAQADQLETQATELETQTTQLDAQLSQLEHRAMLLEDDNCYLKSRVTQLEQRTTQYQDQTAQLALENAKLQSHNVEFEFKMTQLQLQNSRLELEIDQCRAQILRLNDRDAQLEDKIALCVDKIAQLDAQLNPTKPQKITSDVRLIGVPLFSLRTPRWVAVASLIMLCTLYLGIFSAGQWCSASLELPEENRRATNMPTLTLKSFLSGTWRDEIERFARDRFGGRSLLIDIGQSAQKALSARTLFTSQDPIAVHVDLKSLATGEQASQEYDEILGSLMYDTTEDEHLEPSYRPPTLAVNKSALEVNSHTLTPEHKKSQQTKPKQTKPKRKQLKRQKSNTAARVSLRANSKTDSLPNKKKAMRQTQVVKSLSSQEKIPKLPDVKTRSKVRQRSRQSKKTSLSTKELVRDTSRDKNTLKIPPSDQVSKDQVSMSKVLKEAPNTRWVKLKNNRGSIIIHNKMAMVRYMRTKSYKYSMYAQAINLWRRFLPKHIKVYSVLVPNSAGIYAPKTGPYRTSSQQANIQEHQNKMSSSIIKLNGYQTLESHKDEHIFFKSDHHWTARGAYHVYRQLVKASGLKPTPLSQLKRVVVATHWRGSYWGLTRGAPELKEGDLIEAFLPKTTYVGRHWVSRDPEKSHFSFKRPWFRLDRKAYTAFVGSNYRRIQAETSIKNGRKILVVMNSYGNPLVTLLLNNYETVIGVDYRYYKESLKRLILKEEVTDVVFLNGVMSANGRYCHRRLRQLLFPEEKR